MYRPLGGVFLHFCPVQIGEGVFVVASRPEYPEMYDHNEFSSIDGFWGGVGVSETQFLSLSQFLWCEIQDNQLYGM